MTQNLISLPLKGLNEVMLVIWLATVCFISANAAKNVVLSLIDIRCR